MWALHHHTRTARIVKASVVILFVFAATFSMCDLREWMGTVVVWRCLRGSCCRQCQCFIVIGKETVAWAIDIDETFALREDVSIALSVGIVGPLASGFVSFRSRADNDDGYRGVLQTILGNTARQKTLETAQTFASCAYYQNGWLIKVDLLKLSEI